MDRALCYFSFDFDLTVTTTHTWSGLKLMDNKPETVARAASPNLIQFSDAQLLASLIEFVCGTYRMIFCFCTMQFREILEAGLKANQILAPVYERYVGKTLFIIDRQEIAMCSANKASALKSTFSFTNRKFGGVHMDDTIKHHNDYLLNNIEVIQMDPGIGFSRQVGSTLNRGIDQIERSFSNIGRPSSLPVIQEAVYANTSQPGSSRYPRNFDFNFHPVSSKNLTMEKFIGELRKACITPFTRQGALKKRSKL